MSHWYTINIEFEATDFGDADSRHDRAVDALCGCDPDSTDSCIDFVSSLRTAINENGETIYGTPKEIRHQGTPTPSQESATGFVDSPLRGEVEQYVGRLARHLPDDDGTVENADEVPHIAEITTELMAILLTTEEVRFDLVGDAFAKAVDRKAEAKIAKARRDFVKRTHEIEAIRLSGLSEQERKNGEENVRGKSLMAEYRRYRKVRMALSGPRALLVYFTICLILGLLWLN